MIDRVRVGMVGTSPYSDLMHLSALQSHKHAEIVAICGRNQNRADVMAQKYQIPKVYTDYRAMIDSKNLDALVIAVPDNMHYPIAMMALDAGLHVLCEKPLAFTLEQAREMLEKAETAGVNHMTCFTWRWMPHCTYLHQLIEEGYLGRCFHAQLNYRNDYARDNGYQWRWDSKIALGVLGDLGSHLIDLSRWCLGEIEAVNAQLNSFIPHYDSDNETVDPANDSAMLNIRFRNGTESMIHASAVAHIGGRVQEQRFLFHGDKGTLEVDFDSKKKYQVRGARDGEEIQDLAIPESIMQGLDPYSAIDEQRRRIFTEQKSGTRLFIDGIIYKEKLHSDFFDGYKVQQVIDAAFKSHEERAWVSITD